MTETVSLRRNRGGKEWDLGGNTYDNDQDGCFGMLGRSEVMGQSVGGQIWIGPR